MSAREVRLRHAKRLAKIVRSNELAAGRITSNDTKDSYTPVSVPRRQRSAKLVSNANSTIYSMILEQCRSFAVALRTAAPRIARVCALWCDVKRADEAALLNAAIAEIEICIGRNFGGGTCCAYIGLLDPGARSLTYVAASQESNMKDRCLKPCDGIVFQCIKKSDTLMIENLEKAKRMGVKIFGNPEELFPFICTPLRAEVGHPIGILSLDGLCSSATPLDAGVAISIPNGDQHNAINIIVATPNDYYDRLAPFVDKNDEACKRVKLWKLQNRNSTGIPCGVNLKSVATSARVICGHVYSIDRLKGIGSVYSIRWEDGLYETEISFRAIKEMLRLTPGHLGVGVPCDATFLGFVEYAGKVIGENVIRLRSFVHAERIARVPTLPSSTTAELYRQILLSSMHFILCARVAEIWEYDAHNFINIVARMGQDFVFRQMCQPRRLLEIPGHERHTFWEYVSTQVSFPMPHANEVLIVPFGECKANTQNSHLLVITCAPSKLDSKDLIFLRRMSAALASATARMNLRERRAAARFYALHRVSLLCTNPLVSIVDLEADVLIQAERCLPSCNIYLGLLQSGGDNISMPGYDECRAHQSSVFECLPPTSSDSLVLRAPFRGKPTSFIPGTRVQVKYGKLWYAAVIQTDRGHLKYDVTYDLKDWMGRCEQEAGVSIERLRCVPVDRPTTLPYIISAAIAESSDRVWPVIIVPLGCQKGIICVDSWSNENAEPSHDESHVLNFLRTVGSQLGTAVDDRIRGCSLRYILSLTNESYFVRSEIKKTLMTQLRECAIFAKHIKLHRTELLKETDLLELDCKLAAEMLNRCKEYGNSLDGRTILIQANTPFTEFMSVFEDCKVVLNEEGGPVLTRPNLSVFCSFGR